MKALAVFMVAVGAIAFALKRLSHRMWQER